MTGNAIRAARRRAAVRVFDLAQAANVSESKLWRLEQGRARATDEEKARIADALGLSVAVLFGEEVTP